ncbi:pantoate--beta-alanine ligase [Planktosalinus lacus]|nr:pantoate--beta-alanine ligase [Planktosalinus lacus]
MQVYYSISELKPKLNAIKKQEQTIGFVPTMGALHKGHLSLIESAMNQNDTVVVSIFVNPTQFNNKEDFENYPRTIEEDIQIVSHLKDKLMIYVPRVEDIYPNGLQTIQFDFEGIEHEMEGSFRPGHFDGVGSVLKSFFKLIEPNKAYFGEKDFQQLQIVRKLIEIEHIPVQIIACPIMREPTGLAMSSRNKRLSEKQFKEAALIYKVLTEVQADFGIKNVNELTQRVEETFEANTTLKLEYFIIADEETLQPLKNKEKNKKYRAFIAVFAGEIRLIDNIALN